VLLAYLLNGERTEDNAGVIWPALPPGMPVAQKNGWLSDVRHTAALVYTHTGPKIIVVLSYRSALSLTEAQGLGRRVIALVSP
jgi:hypothetical protein